jgi:DNA segregation ATPase FtsK/SpoIIIE-like protein
MIIIETSFNLSVLTDYAERPFSQQAIDLYCMPVKNLITRKEMKLKFDEICDNASMMRIDMVPSVENADLETYLKYFETLRSTYPKLHKEINGEKLSLYIPKDNDRQILPLKRILWSEDYNEYLKEHEGGLIFALGETVDNRIIIQDLRDLVHLLIAGTTGSGKYVCLHTIITSLMYLLSPDQLQFVLFDMKMVEMSFYAQSPYLLEPICTDEKEAMKILENLVNEMQKRFNLLMRYGVRNIDSYNKIPGVDKKPYIVVVIDEFADLMLSNPKCEEYIKRLAQKARAGGIHIILSTQKPSAEVVTPVIKANMPTRIALSVASHYDSQIILDETGAEDLNKKGDMLLKTDEGIIRLQGAYLSEDEIDAIVADTIEKYGTNKFTNIQTSIYPNQDNPENLYVRKIGEGETKDGKTVINDELYLTAMHVIEQQRASKTMVKTLLKCGDRKANEYLDKLQALKIIGEYVSQQYPVKMSYETLYSKFITVSEANA